MADNKYYIIRLYEEDEALQEEFQTLFYALAANEQEAIAKCKAEYPECSIISILEE